MRNSCCSRNITPEALLSFRSTLLQKTQNHMYRKIFDISEVILWREQRTAQQNDYGFWDVNIELWQLTSIQGGRCLSKWTKKLIPRYVKCIFRNKSSNIIMFCLLLWAARKWFSWWHSCMKTEISNFRTKVNIL